MLADIAFEQISGNYWYATYGPFRVIMMKDSGYINATKLCSSGGKDYKNWSRLNGSRQLIEAVEKRVALVNTQPSFQSLENTLGDGPEQICARPSVTCKIVEFGGYGKVERIISGTYCHPKLIPHIASWVSVDFAIMVSDIVEHYLVSKYKCKITDMKVQLEICAAAEQHHKLAKEEAIQQCEVAQETKEKAMQEAQELEKVVKAKKLQLDT